MTYEEAIDRAIIYKNTLKKIMFDRWFESMYIGDKWEMTPLSFNN